MRCEAASANGQETLSMFIASVLAANYAGVPVETINQLAAAYLVSRAVYNFTYISLQTNPALAPVRSFVWMASLAPWTTLLIKAGNLL